MIRKRYADWAKEYPDHLVLMRTGFFYSAWSRAAEVLNEVLGYKLVLSARRNIPYTGGTSLDIILDSLERNCINYLVIEDGEIIDKKEFDLCLETFYRPEDFTQEGYEDPDISDEEKLKTIDSLLNSIDPTTGEILEEDHFINDRVVQAVLMTAKKAITKRQERLANRKEAAGARWTTEEDEQLAREYTEGLSLDEIAEIHKRTAFAIDSRIRKLGI